MHMNAIRSVLARTKPVCLTSRDGGGVYRSEDAPVQRLAAELRKQFEEAAPRTIVVVVLEGPLSASAHARVFGPVLRMIAKGNHPSRYMVINDVACENDYDAEAALQKESRASGLKLVCVWREGSTGPRLLGAVDEKVNESYTFALGRWVKGETTTARDLAEATGISIQAASNRMAKAASLGVLCKVDESAPEGGGVQRVFVPVI